METTTKQINGKVNLNLQLVIEANEEIIAQIIEKVGVEKFASELANRCEPFDLNKVLNDIKFDSNE